MPVIDETQAAAEEPAASAHRPGDGEGAEEATMSLGEHLEELRLRLIYSLVTLVVCFLVTFFVFRNQAFNLVTAPIFDALVKLGYQPVLIALRPQDRFLAYIKVCVVLSLVIASPVILYHFWKFVAAGLYPRERRYVHLIFPFSAASFVAGVLFAYYVLVRFGLRFLYSFGDSEHLRTTPTVRDNVDFVIKMSFVMGLVFQLPLVILGLEKIGVVTVEQLARGRRYAIVGCLVVGMTLTDPSAVTQLMLAGPMYALYELGILLCRIFQ